MIMPGLKRFWNFMNDEYLGLLVIFVLRQGVLLSQDTVYSKIPEFQFIIERRQAN